MSSQTTDKVSIITLFLTILFTSIPVTYGFWLLKNNCQNDGNSLDCQHNYVSFGEQNLINYHNQDIKSHLNKEAGIENFRNGNLLKAQIDFQNTWLNAKSRQEDDPEAFIYFNNARYASKDYLQILVSVPIISYKLDIAKDILRGVAQAQSEINQQGGINNKFLRVGIADDKNDEEQAKKIAESAVNDKKILAVVGHNVSKVSKAAAPIYEKGKLVMVTPTSYALDLTNYSSSYIFKVVTEVVYYGNKLNEFSTKLAQLNNFFICFDGEERVNVDFYKSFLARGNVNQVLPDECDVSRKDFNPKALITQAKSKNAQSLLLAASAQKFDKFIELAKANNRQLALFSNPSLAVNETLKKGKEFVEGMVLVTPWYPDVNSRNPFVTNAQQLWSEPVSWRTAMAYDATKAIIEGLKQSNNLTREELQQQLHKINICGATGNISFATTGERKETRVFLIRVKKDSSSNNGYKFTLDKSVKDHVADNCRNN